MDVTESGMFTDVSEEQPSKTESPINVTEPEICTDVRALHP